MLHPVAERHQRWNFFSFSVYTVFVLIAQAFVDPTTVLPVFVSHFTDSAVVIGSFVAIRNGCWAVPQLLTAGLIGRSPRVRPLAVLTTTVSRLSNAPLAIIVLLFANSRGTLVLVSFFAFYALYWLAAGTAGTPVPELSARVVAPQRRGRLWGTGQFMGGIGAVAVGFLVRWLLGSHGPHFPTNWAIVFGAAAFFGAISSGGLAIVREGKHATHQHRVPLVRYVVRAPALLAHNHAFARLVLTQVLFGLAAMGFPFYILLAREVLHISTGMVGIYLVAQTAGSTGGGLLCGYLADHFGNRTTIRLSMTAALATPLLGLLSFALQSHGGVAQLVLALAFLSLGTSVAWSASMAYPNLVLETVPLGERQTYVALLNTIGGLAALAPILGGVVLSVSNYPVLFGITALPLIGGLAMSFRLHEPRRAPVLVPAER